MERARAWSPLVEWLDEGAIALNATAEHWQVEEPRMDAPLEPSMGMTGAENCRLASGVAFLLPSEGPSVKTGPQRQ